MVEKKIKFITSGQLMSFCDTSILGLMSIKLGLPMRLIVDGEDEDLANEYFTKYEFE